MRYIAFDSHKRYTFASVEEAESGKRTDVRIEHTRGAIREFLKPYEPQTPVAVETTGTLPTVWIPDGVLRDTRELFRTRMVLARQSTRLKNRILDTC